MLGKGTCLPIRCNENEKTSGYNRSWETYQSWPLLQTRNVSTSLSCFLEKCTTQIPGHTFKQPHTILTWCILLCKRFFFYLP